jgi:hypothetical protein
MYIDVQQQDREALKELMTHAEIYATRTMQVGGGVTPTLFIQTLDGPIMLRTENFRGEQSKDDFAKTARLMCVAHGATATVLVSEAWMRSAKKGEHLDVTKAPSQSPDRQEVLIFMGETRHGGGCQKFLPMVRDEAGRFLGFGESPTIDCDKIKGRFANFLAEKYPDFEDQREARELLRRTVEEKERRPGRDMGYAR